MLIFLLIMKLSKLTFSSTHVETFLISNLFLLSLWHFPHVLLVKLFLIIFHHQTSNLFNDASCDINKSMLKDIKVQIKIANIFLLLDEILTENSKPSTKMLNVYNDNKLCINQMKVIFTWQNINLPQGATFKPLES